MRILTLFSIAYLLEESFAAFLPSRSFIHGRNSYVQQQSNQQNRDPSSYRIREGLALHEQNNEFNDEGEWNDNGIIDPDASMAELELALAESQRKRAALEDELMVSMAESVLNRTPQMALAELEVAKANRDLFSRDLIKVTTGLLGPIGGIAGVSAAGVVAGRNFLQQRQAKIEEMERQAYQTRLDAALKKEKTTVQTAAQGAAAVTGITALGVALSGTLDDLQLPSLDGNSAAPTISTKNEQQMTQKKSVEPKPELPYIEEKIKQAELEVQAKEKAVLESTQKSQRLEQLLKAEEQSSKALQAQLQAAEEAAIMANTRLSSAELATKEAEIRALAAERLEAQLKAAEDAAKLATARLSSAELAAKEAEIRAMTAERVATTGLLAPITNIDMDKKEDNTLATRKKEEAESLDLKRKVAEGMSGMRSTSKPTSPLPFKSTIVAPTPISTPAAGVAATALQNPFDIFSKATNNPAIAGIAAVGITAVAGVATAIGVMNNKDDDEKNEKKEDAVRATMKISKPKTKAKKQDELPFNIPPPPKEIASPSRVSKRGDDAASSSVNETKPQKSGTKSISSPPTTSNGPKGSPGTTPKFISSYDGSAAEGAPKFSSKFGASGTSSPFGTAPNGVQTDKGASNGASPFQTVPGTGAPKGASPFQTGAGASKFSSSPKGEPPFGPSSKSSSNEESLFFTGDSKGSPFGPGFSPKGPGPGVPKGFGTSPSPVNGQSSGGVGSVESPGPGTFDAGGPKAFVSPSPSSGLTKDAPKGFRSPASNEINDGTGGAASPADSPSSSNSESSTPKGIQSSPFGSPSKGSPKGGSSFFTGSSTGSPFGPGATPKGFGSGPGVPKGFPSPANGQSSGIFDTAKAAFNAPNDFGVAAGTPKGFPNPTNGQSSGKTGTGTVAPKGFGSALGAPKGFQSPTNGQSTDLSNSSKGAGAGTAAPKGFGVPYGFNKGPTVPKGFTSPTNGQIGGLDTGSKGAQAEIVTPKGVGSGPGAPTSFSSPASGQSSDPDSSSVAPRGFGSAPGVSKGFTSPFGGPNSRVNGDISDAKDAVSSSKSGNEFATPKIGSPFGSPSNAATPSSGATSGVKVAGAVEDSPASSTSYLSSMQGPPPKNQEVKPSYSPFGREKKAEPSKSSTYSPLGQWTPGSANTDASANLGAPSVEKAPTETGPSSASFRPLSGGKSPADVNNSFTGRRKREFKPFPKSGSSTVAKGAPASFEPFPKSRPDTPGGPTFPMKPDSSTGSSSGTASSSDTKSGKLDGTKTYTSFTGKDGAEVITTRPFGNGPRQSSSGFATPTGRSSFDGKKSFQPLSKTGLQSPFKYSPKGNVNGVEKKTFKPYSTPAEATTSKPDLPAEFKPTFPPEEGAFSKGSAISSPSMPERDTNFPGSASVLGSSSSVQAPISDQPPSTSTDSAASSTSYLSNMQGPPSKNQGVKSSYSPFGGEKKAEPSKASTYSPLGQWTPGSSKADASANLGAPSTGSQTSVPTTPAMDSTSVPASSQQKDQTFPKPTGTSNSNQNSAEPQRSIWDSLSATISSFSGRSSDAAKPETGAIDTSNFPQNNVQSSYSPFGTKSNPEKTNGNLDPAARAQTAPREAFGVGITVDPARNIAETKPADQGATLGSSPVESSYAPFAKNEGTYSPFGPTPQSSAETSGISASNPNPSEPKAPVGYWSPADPATSDTATNESGFSPFAEWLKNEQQPGQPVGSTNVTPPPAAPGASSVSTQGPNENMASQNAANPVYFSPNSPGALSKEPLLRSYAANQSYSNQAGSVDDIRRPSSTNSYGNRRAVRNFQSSDGDATGSTSRYTNRAVDPTQSYSRPDPYKQGSDNVRAPEKQYLDQVPRTGSAAVPNAQADPFYSNPYGTSSYDGRKSYGTQSFGGKEGTTAFGSRSPPNTISEQPPPKAEPAPQPQRARSNYKDSKPSNNWFDDGRGGRSLLNQDWQWYNN